MDQEIRIQNAVDQRDRIMFGEPYSKEKYDGGIRKFYDMNWRKFDALIDGGILDLNKKQSDASRLTAFYDFLSEHPLLRCFGYVCSPDEKETADMVVIEGIDYKGVVTMRMLVDFVSMFRNADEFAAGVKRLYCRYL